MSDTQYRQPQLIFFSRINHARTPRSSSRPATINFASKVYFGRREYNMIARANARARVLHRISASVAVVKTLMRVWCGSEFLTTIRDESDDCAPVGFRSNARRDTRFCRRVPAARPLAWLGVRLRGKCVLRLCTATFSPCYVRNRWRFRWGGEDGRSFRAALFWGQPISTDNV